MIVENLGHASFRITGEKVSIIFDPYKDDSVPGLNFPKGISCNFLFISHDHFDHCGAEQVKIEKTENKVNFEEILVPHDKNNGSLRGMNKVHIISLDGYKIIHLGDIGTLDLNNDIIDKMKDADIVLCPINGFFTIGALDAIKLRDLIKPKLLIPMHYEVKSKCIGYPDNGQIDIFIRNMKSVYYCQHSQIEINDDVLKYDSIIFEDYTRR